MNMCARQIWLLSCPEFSYGHVEKGQMALHRNIVLVITLENEYGLLCAFSLSAKTVGTHVCVEPRIGYQDLYQAHFARIYSLLWHSERPTASHRFAITPISLPPQFRHHIASLYAAF